MKQFKLSIISTVVLASFAATSSAQEVKKETKIKPEEAMEQIIVTGFRRQIRGGIAAKADADGVADFISGDEFGKQPDLNLADSLRRLPGVSTVFDEDEGRFVSVRGLPSRYTTIALNGTIIPNAWGAMDRSQNVEAIPSFAVKRSGVYKSLTSDLDANSIGGYINNTLVSAFDHDGFKLISDFRLGHHSYDTPGGHSNPSPKGQILISDTFGADNQFGYLLAGSYFAKHRDQSKSNRLVKFDDDTPYISRAETVDYTNSITRYNFLARLEYLGDQLRTALSASYFDYQYDEVRYITRIDGKGDRVSTENGGSFSQGRGELILDRFPIGTETSFLMWDLDYIFSNDSTLTTNVTLSRARYELFEDASSVNFRSADLDALGYSYDLAGQDLGDFRLSPITYNDASALVNVDGYNFVGDFWPRADEEGQDIDQIKIDYEIDINDFTYKVGALARNFESYVDNNRAHFYSSVDEIPPASEFVSTTIYNEGLGVTTAAIDPDLFLNYFYSNPALFQDDIEKGQIDVLKGDVNYEEDITAAYTMASYTGDNFKITAGLRYEYTDFSATGVNNSDANKKITRSENYANLLPSIIGSYEIKRGMRLRAGYNQSIGRPDPDDLARRETVSEGDGGDIKISRGNANLQPRQADNYDLAFDYTIGEGEFASVAVFYKDITDEIFTFKDVSEVVNSNGQTVQQTITQPTNLSDVSVQGLELTLVNDKFDTLPAPWNNFGFTSNFTWMDADLDLPQSNTDITDTRNIDQLNGSQKFKMNASLLFEYKKFDAKLTYANHSKRRRSASTSDENFDSFTEPYTQIDIFARYSVTKNFKVFVEGRNITNEVRMTSYGSGIGRERNEFGRSFWLGVSYKL